jgi:hypothetical protein
MLLSRPKLNYTYLKVEISFLFLTIEAANVSFELNFSSWHIYLYCGSKQKTLQHIFKPMSGRLIKLGAFVYMNIYYLLNITRKLL